VTVLVPVVTSIVVTPNPILIYQGHIREFTAEVTGQNNPPLSVTWSVTGSTNSGTSIGENGLLEIAGNEAATLLTVTATSTYNTSISGVANVGVLSGSTVSSVTITPNQASVNQGKTQQFNAVVYLPDEEEEEEEEEAVDQSVSWAVSGSSNSETNISSSGLLTVASNESASLLTITATSTADTLKSGTAIVIVTSVSSVTVSPGVVYLQRGANQQFSAVVGGTNEPPQGVRWAVNADASYIFISPSNGYLAVGSTAPYSTYTVTATSVADPSKSGTATVDVYSVSSVSVSPTGTLYLNRGDTQQFTATVSGNGSVPQTVTWRVTGSVSGTTIGEDGLLTVASNETATSLTVRATSTVSTGIYSDKTVTMGQVSSVTVNPSTTLTLNRGDTQQYTATVTGNFTGISQAVNWSVTGGVTGTTINEDGLLTVASNETATSLTVRATSTVNTSYAGTRAVNIRQVTSVTVGPSTAVTLNRGDTQQYTATVSGNNSPPQAVNWTVTGGGEGTYIASNGPNNGLLVVASYETATSLTVTATSEYDATKSGSRTANIRQVTSVVVSPASAYLSLGETRQFSATVNVVNGAPTDFNWSVIGSTSTTAINSSGFLVLAIDEGAVVLTVRATSTYDATKRGDATVNVLSEREVWNVTDTATWNTAVSGIIALGNNKSHTININDNITRGGYTSNTFGSLQGVIVLIQGSHTISLSSNGNLLRIGNQQTVILKDVTLQGIIGNNASLCLVNGTGAVFRMEGVARIQGNNSSSSGGGASIGSSATFIMRDNATISGNTSSSDYGGGVYLVSSTFTMQGSSSISGNRLSTSGGGSRYGCGVYITGSNSSFTMEGNASISGNTNSGSSSNGGGVCISSGSLSINGNASISGNTAGSGGGVYVDIGGTFRMLGGTISANSASGNGGGVYVGYSSSSSPYVGTLIKTGGTIYGNDALPTLRNSAGSSGHVARRQTGYSVYQWRNLTAGPSDNTTSNNFWTND